MLKNYSTIQNTNNMQNKYVHIFLEPLYECLSYNPKFGHNNKEGFSLKDFLILYGSDPFYSWIGLDSPYMFTAHKAAGCMTSIYRQIGIGCERLFREILCDTAKYESYDSAKWSYTTKTKAGKDKVLSLDGRLELADIKNLAVREKVANWINEYGRIIGIDPTNLKGAVFEVRQGYKSKDSKRQNGDIDNATVAYAYNYLPVFTVFSGQIDNDIVLRYTNNRCAIIIGSKSPSPYVSLFAFTKEVLGYDLAKFFEENSPYIKGEVQKILKKLFNVNTTV